MAEKSKIYTKTGDSGETSLYGGTRVKKSSSRIRSIGVVDELNASLGVALSFSQIPKIDDLVNQIQENLFVVGANLATNKESLGENSVAPLEKAIDELDGQLEPLKNFILPGGSQAAAFWHLARTICRRAERSVVSLSKKETVDPEILKYLNRLADLLFVLARTENKLAKTPDIPWKSSK